MILGIDVGGTHTDSVLMNNRKIVRKSKVLTDKENILKSVLMATEAVANPEDIRNLQRIVLSTTLTTNAVVQNQLDPVGLVVMNGPGVAPKDLPLYDKANYIAGYMSHRGIEAEAPDRSEPGRARKKSSRRKTSTVLPLSANSRPAIRRMNRKWMPISTIWRNIHRRATSSRAP